MSGATSQQCGCGYCVERRSHDALRCKCFVCVTERMIHMEAMAILWSLPILLLLAAVGGVAWWLL